MLFMKRCVALFLLAGALILRQMPSSPMGPPCLAL